MAAGQPAAAAAQRAIYAACVLSRLPLLRQPSPEWQAEYAAWTALRRQREGLVKQYPAADKQRQQQQEQQQSQQQQQQQQLQQQQQQAQEAAGSSSRSSGSPVSAMTRLPSEPLVLLVRSRDGGDWSLPAARHAPGETIRQTAERALREAVGPAPAYFVGNAPAAHADLSAADAAPLAAAAADGNGGGADGGLLFLHLARAAGPPWDAAAGAGGVAWVSPGELREYLRDEALALLVQKVM